MEILYTVYVGCFLSVCLFVWVGKGWRRDLAHFCKSLREGWCLGSGWGRSGSFHLFTHIIQHPATVSPQTLVSERRCYTFGPARERALTFKSVRNRTQAEDWKAKKNSDTAWRNRVNRTLWLTQVVPQVASFFVRRHLLPDLYQWVTSRYSDEIV